MVTIFAALFFICLLYVAATQDLKKREVSNLIYIPMMIPGFFLEASLLGAFYLPLPLLVLALLSDQEIVGGADIKILIPIGFSVGPYFGLIGLFLAMVIVLVHQKLKSVKTPNFALIPYFAVSFHFMTAFLVL